MLLLIQLKEPKLPVLKIHRFFRRGGVSPPVRAVFRSSGTIYLRTYALQIVVAQFPGLACPDSSGTCRTLGFEGSTDLSPCLRGDKGGLVLNVQLRNSRIYRKQCV